MAGFEDFLDTRDVAKRLGISRTAVHRLAQRGTLPSQWMGGSRYWHKETIRRYEEDEAAQARRRSAAKLRIVQAGKELTVEQVVQDAAKKRGSK